MKTIDIPSPSAEISVLLAQAKREDLIVRAPDGSEFMVTAIDELDREVAATQRNAKLMAFLDERAKGGATVPIAEVKRQLGL